MTNPLHEAGAPKTVWTTVNRENFPGVGTPLGWTFWRDPLERGMKGAFCNPGVLSLSTGTVPDSIDDRFSAAVYCRFAANADSLRRGTCGEGTSFSATAWHAVDGSLMSKGYVVRDGAVTAATFSVEIIDGALFHHREVWCLDTMCRVHCGGRTGWVTSRSRTTPGQGVRRCSLRCERHARTVCLIDESHLRLPEWKEWERVDDQ